MTESGLLALRQLLLTGYDELKARLTQRLGSSELASDAVQDTWLRLHHAENIGRVSNPANYLFRIALNIARDRLSSERRYLTAVQIEQMFDLADDSADVASTAEARSELQLVERLISELPPRQREILVAARLDGLPRGEIAQRLGISLSLVEKELKLAHEYCLARRDQLTRK
jgi:RNA polymerase sigma factor (sigma-70 family)